MGEPLYEDLSDAIFGVPGRWRLRICPGEDCGLVWMDPCPVAEDIPKTYVRYYTHEETKPGQSFWTGGVMKKMFDSYLSVHYGYASPFGSYLTNVLSLMAALFPRLSAEAEHEVMYLPWVTGGRVLEVGCGNGKMLEYLSRRGWTAEGIDIDPVAVEVGKKRGLQVRQGTLSEQGYKEGEFDAVIMNHVFEHLDDPDALLGECHRVLKDDGAIVVVTPNVKAMNHKIFKPAWRGLEPPRHIFLHSPETLRKFAGRNGFGKSIVKTTPRLARPIFIESMMIRNNRISDMAGKETGLFLKIMGRLNFYLEWMLSFASPFVGEELVIVARK